MYGASGGTCLGPVRVRTGPRPSDEVSLSGRRHREGRPLTPMPGAARP